MYTYQIEGVTITAKVPRQADTGLSAALAVAANMSFQESRPVTLLLNGQPYRTVSVDFVNSHTRRT